MPDEIHGEPKCRACRSLERASLRYRNQRDTALDALERLFSRIHEDDDGHVEFDADEPGFTELVEQTERLLFGRDT